MKSFIDGGFDISRCSALWLQGDNDVFWPFHNCYDGIFMVIAHNHVVFQMYKFIFENSVVRFSVNELSYEGLSARCTLWPLSFRLHFIDDVDSSKFLPLNMWYNVLLEQFHCFLFNLHIIVPDSSHNHGHLTQILYDSIISFSVSIYSVRFLVYVQWRELEKCDKQ